MKIPIYPVNYSNSDPARLIRANNYKYTFDRSYGIRKSVGQTFLKSCASNVFYRAGAILLIMLNQSDATQINIKRKFAKVGLGYVKLLLDHTTDVELTPVQKAPCICCQLNIVLYRI